jgi:hypothetical protein
MIRGTDARTVTDIPTGKQLPIIAFQVFGLSLMRNAVGVMEGWSTEIPNSKHQITNKSQIPIPNDQNIKQVWSAGGGLVIVICLGFVICYLEFLVSIGLLPALPVDQMEIAAIDENTRTLSQDKHRITPV